MKLEIVRIAEAGVAFKERIHISVLVAANLGFYSVLNTVLQSNGLLANVIRHGYFFGPIQVKPGDNIVLYTGPGKYTSTVRTDGGTDYFFYWSLPQTIFGVSESRATLVEMAGWNTNGL
jgi:hypothetical protein